MSPFALRDVRDGVLLVEYPGSSDEEANRAAVSLARRLPGEAGGGLLDAVAGARTLCAIFDPDRLARERLVRAIERLSARGEGTEETRRLLRIPVVYDGLDLPDLARACGLPERELARRHAAARYRVAFVGFAPGFAYLSGLPAELEASRLSTPRPRVAAGSVAIGGLWTGVYPSESPGGWRLIGRTSVRLFDPRADPPSLLTAGDRVDFEAVSESASPPPERPRAGETENGGAVFRVLTPGLYTSIQGAARWGLASSGIPPGGAMDTASLAFANALMRNAAATPALEMTLSGAELEALQEVVVAVSGGDALVERNGAPAACGEAFRLSAGERLRIGRVTRGARAYLAVRGGVALPRAAGEPTRRLSAGERILLGSAREEPMDGRRTSPPASMEGAPFRIVRGPEAAGLAKGELARFLSTSWTVSPESDRRGLRLSGEPLVHGGEPEIAPSGTVPGTVQLPGGGLPILLGPDGPVTGGYPRIAAVIGADLPRLGQLPPGAVLRFEEVSLGEALAARRAAGSTITFP